jgi:integrase
VRGSIQKRVTSRGIARYYAVVDERTEDGKRVRKWHGPFDRKRDAETFLREHLRARQLGDYIAPTDATLAQFVADEWLPSARTSLRESTLASYERNLRLHALPRLGRLPLAAIDAPRLNRLYAELADAGLSPRSVRYVHTILHRVYRDAVKWRRVGRNPAADADPPRASADRDRHELATWSAEDASRFLSACRERKGRGTERGDRLYAAWVVLLTTGLRRGELLGLRWQDVDLDGRTLAVRQTLVDSGKGHAPTFSVPKTERGRRAVALDRATVEVLREHRKRQAEARLAAKSWRDHGLVFTARDGSPLHPERFSREFARRVASAEVPRIRLHDLRHTHASLALTRGVHLKVVSERLGHSTIAITGDIYAHVSPSLQAEAAETVASLFM